MPELPEVECVRLSLTPAIKSRTVSRVRIDLPKLARPNPQTFRRGISGRTIKQTARHGKLLCLELDNGSYWTIHLGMTGQLIMAQTKPRVKHIHLTISFKGSGPNLYFRDMRQFGGMTYYPDRDALEAGPWGLMGPDALNIGQEEFIDRLAGRKGPLKSLLLNQTVLAGVGNIYADEALHRAGLSPRARPADLNSERLSILHGHVVETLHEALERGGSSIRNFVDAKGRPGTFQNAHRVYQRTGEPCPACGCAVQKIVLGGRSTHFCPQCQSQ